MWTNKYISSTHICLLLNHPSHHLDNEQCLKLLLGVFKTKKGANSLYLWVQYSICIVHYQDEIRPSDDARPLAVSRSLLTVHTKEYWREKHICRVNTFLYTVTNTKHIFTYFLLIFSKTVLLKVSHVKHNKICIWGECKPQKLGPVSTNTLYIIFLFFWLAGYRVSATPLLMSSIYIFLGMSGLQPKGLPYHT